MSLMPPLAVGIRRAILAEPVALASPGIDLGPGVVIFDGFGRQESISPAAEQWIAEFVEEPPPVRPSESKMVQAIAARARIRTRGGDWLLVYGTRLAGKGGSSRTAVIIHPATPQEVAPVIAMSYWLTDRETEVAMHCVQGQDTRGIARTLAMSRFTVQDHLKSIFTKTGVHSRGEMVGRVFLDHYVTRWEEPIGAPARPVRVGRGRDQPGVTTRSLSADRTATIVDGESGIPVVYENGAQSWRVAVSTGPRRRRRWRR
jgi:DNA-binding CsgD family transcriptional regulator